MSARTEAVFGHPLFGWLALVVGVAVLAESLWLLVTRARSTDWPELATDLVTFFVGEGLRVAMRGVFLGVYVALWELAPWRLPTSALTAVACFLGVDLLLYLWHRLLHRWPLGWALHSVHHTGATFALPLAGRLPWPLRLVDDLVTAPLVLLGFEPLLVYLCLAVSFVVQFLAHAGGVGRLGPLELVLNTPSNHRVHHHAEGPGPQRNFGAALIVWDRLFGTYAEEAGPARFGVTGVPSVVNPFVVQGQGLVRWWRARRGS
jgi:sterol desaturase/sphingolipid hydroxylase (fatty acid hydroxylase superfamily)